jgi:hypothetical protein
MKTLIKLLLVGLAARWVISKLRERSAPQSVPSSSTPA